MTIEPHYQHWLRTCYGRLGHLFPTCPPQPGYHKRVKAAAPLICQTSRYLATLCPSWNDELRMLDAIPVPAGTNSRWYWGLKLYMITTAEEMPVAWCLVRPKIGEREVARDLLGHARDLGAPRE